MIIRSSQTIAVPLKNNKHWKFTCEQVDQKEYIAWWQDFHHIKWCLQALNNLRKSDKDQDFWQEKTITGCNYDTHYQQLTSNSWSCNLQIYILVGLNMPNTRRTKLALKQALHGQANIKNWTHCNLAPRCYKQHKRSTIQRPDLGYILLNG